MFTLKRFFMVLSVLLSFLAVHTVFIPGAQAGEVMVAAAASLTDAFREAARQFEKVHPDTTILLDLASSGRLCVQIEQGAPVDLYASASQRYMDRLQNEGLIDAGTRRDFAANRMVLVEQAGSHRLNGLDDLMKPDVMHIAIGDPSHVPAGRYAKEVLVSSGLWNVVRDKLVFGINVRQVRDYVATGEVEAGLVFASDAIVPQVRVVRVVSETLHSPIRYPVAVLRSSEHPSEARKFIDFLLSSQGQHILKRYGFSAI